MSYSQMVDLLRKENKNEIVFVKAGAFYIAVEEDAVFLNKKLKLKCTCYRKNTCKVGVPIKALDKYLVKIEKLGYAYHVYSVDKEKIELNLIDETKVEVVAYNEQADYTLQNIKIRNNVFVYGKLQNNEIVINKIIKI